MGQTETYVNANHNPPKVSVEDAVEHLLKTVEADNAVEHLEALCTLQRARVVGLIKAEGDLGETLPGLREEIELLNKLLQDLTAHESPFNGEGRF